MIVFLQQPLLIVGDSILDNVVP